MAIFDELYAAGAAMLMDYLAAEVTYTPAGGAGVTLPAIISMAAVDEADDLDGRRLSEHREVTIPRTAAAAGLDGAGAQRNYLAQPATNATVTIDGTSYAVEAIVSQSASFSKLALVRHAAAERSRRGYRLANK